MPLDRAGLFIALPTSFRTLTVNNNVKCVLRFFLMKGIKALLYLMDDVQISNTVDQCFPLPLPAYFVLYQYNYTP